VGQLAARLRLGLLAAEHRQDTGQGQYPVHGPVGVGHGAVHAALLSLPARGDEHADAAGVQEPHLAQVDHDRADARHRQRPLDRDATASALPRSTSPPTWIRTYRPASGSPVMLCRVVTSSVMILRSGWLPARQCMSLGSAHTMVAIPRGPPFG
jgi:hypothetical protein